MTQKVLDNRRSHPADPASEETPMPNTHVAFVHDPRGGKDIRVASGTEDFCTGALSAVLAAYGDGYVRELTPQELK